VGKQSGLGDALYLHGYDRSGDIGSVDKVSGGAAPIDTTGIDKAAMERILGLRDGGIDYKAFFNPDAATGVHIRLSTLPTSDQIVTYCRGTTLGNPAACLVAKQLNYDPKRGNSGEINFDVSSVGNAYGLEWGQLLTAGKRTDTTATNGTGVDFGVGSPPLFNGAGLFGAQFYLHVFAFTGTSVTVKIQESSDNGVGDAWVDVVGGGFTAATGITAQRLETARGQTVERYLRAVTTGTFSNAVFAVVANRNDVSTVF
jgi:hypothetical protein